MKETLEAEKKRLEENIKKYNDLHKESANMANTFRKQLKGIERALEVYTTTDAQAVQDISEGIK